jgi:hypothetical protein
MIKDKYEITPDRRDICWEKKEIKLIVVQHNKMTVKPALVTTFITKAIT